ncbi:MAG: helix-turn-helix domain-containing protein [Thermomicrobiales bacterium]
MYDKSMIRVRRQSDGTLARELPDGSTVPVTSQTDWARLEAMTEAEIEAIAASDPDNPPLTDDELRRFKPVPNPRQIRQRLHLTQEQFAARFGVPLGTLRDWEQGVRQPDSAAKTLLRVIDRDPDAVERALSGTP